MKEQTIESVREELKKYPDLLYRFNLGVELAQKEFLDFLEKETHPEQYLLLKKELKQSLGVKE